MTGGPEGEVGLAASLTICMLQASHRDNRWYGTTPGLKPMNTDDNAVRADVHIGDIVVGCAEAKSLLGLISVISVHPTSQCIKQPE